MPRFPFVHTVLLLFALAGAASPAMAATSFDISWAALDPGDDWAWKMVQSVFPIDGTPPTSTGTAATVVGQIVGQLTGFVMAIAMSYLAYTTIINIHRVAESSQILSNGMSSLFLVRLGFAAVMMFPLSSGFSTGQAAVLQATKWGIGMARVVYTNAIKAIGPDAMVVADPIIPGTAITVLDLMQNELCRALINQASGTTLVPAPTVTTISNSNGGNLTYTYSLAPGNGTGSATCGTISLVEPLSAGANLAGVSIDMTSQQNSILQNILTTIRPQIESVAQNYWQTRSESALSPLQTLYTTTTQSYTQQLTNAATQITSQIRSKLATSTDARSGNVGLLQNETQQSALGWTSAGAYYLEFARINGLTLSLASSTPIVNMPSFDGLSPSLKSDLAPLFTSSTGFLTQLRNYVNAADGLTTPGANADTSTGQYSSSDPGSAVERLFRTLTFTPTLLNTIVAMLTPTAGDYWTDPFGGLVAMGNKLITVAVSALGAAGIVAGGAGTAGSPLFNVLTLGVSGAIANGISALMQFFAVPVFFTCMGLLIPGLTIAFILPMVPWLIWMAGVAGYLILVCEAVVAVPLWMLAHMTFEGEGLHGRGIAGYELIFNLLFRPVLMLLGLFLGYFIFTAMSWLIRMSFGIAAGFVLGNGWLVTNWLGLIILLNIFVLTHVITATMSFRMISIIPHHLPKLIGFSSTNRVDMDEFSQGAALVGAGSALKSVEQSVTPKRLQYGGGAGLGGQNQSQTSTAAIGYSSGSSSSSGGSAGQSARLDTTLQATTDVKGSPPHQDA